MDDRPKIDVEKVLGLADQVRATQLLYNEEIRNVLIYGTSHPHIYKKPALWRRVMWSMQDFFGRVRDAWLVLIGKAEIRDGDD